MGKYNAGFEIIRDAGIPVIIIGKKIEGFSSTNITANNFNGALLATNHLVNAGMKDIAFLFGQMESTTAIHDRYEGYLAALRVGGIKPKDELTIRDRFSFEGGVSAANELLSRGVHFDSIFASNDIMAIGCIELLLEKGYDIPGDVSVIGYDDIPASRIIKPRLSTVHNPEKLIGAEVIRQIIQIIQYDNDNFEETVFEPQLLIRDSTQNSQ